MSEERTIGVALRERQVAGWRSWARAMLPWLLAALAGGLAYGSPIRSQEGSDAWGTLLTAQALLVQGTPYLDAYPAATAGMGHQFGPHGAHMVYNFPLGTSLVALPLVALANLAGMDMATRAHDHALQNLLGALLAASALLLCYRIGRYWLQPTAALLIAASLTFGTTLITTMASALWSIDLSTVLILGCLALLLRPPCADSVRGGLLAGALLALAYVTRPTTITFALPLLLYLLLLRRRTGLGVALGGAALIGLFVGFSLRYYTMPLPPYYAGSRLGQRSPLLLLIALYGHLLSPGRGVLIWSPQLLLVLAGATALLPRLRREPLFWLALAWLGLHLLVISSFSHWWGGMGYGNRLIVDALPALLLLAILVWHATRPALEPLRRRIGAGLFLGLSAIGVLIHSGQGLFNQRTLDWNWIYDTHIDHYPLMLFDWRYPAFLASWPQLEARGAEYLVRPIPPVSLWGQTLRSVSELRTDPRWRPDHVAVSPDLAVLLDRNWYGYEPGWDARWMRASGRIWVVSDNPARVKISLTPVGMNEGGRPGDEGTLRIRLDGEPILTRPIVAGERLDLWLQLRAGPNDLLLELAAGEARLAPDQQRLFGAAFRAIALTSLP